MGLRVLQIIGGVADGWGGPSKVVAELSRELAARGHTVELLTTDAAPRGQRVPAGDAARSLADGYVTRLHRCDLVRPPYPSVAHTRDLWRRARDFDVAHVHGLFNAPVSAAQAVLRARGVPYVVRACGMLDPYGLAQRGRLKGLWYTLLERPNLLGAARIQVSTRLEAEAVGALGLGAKVAVIPQGVDAPPRSDAPRPLAAPYLIFLSRVARKKGLLLLLDAYAALTRGAHHGVDLVIAGPDEYGHRAEVEARAAALGLTERVHFTGMVRGEVKTAWLAHAEAFVLPSHDENFGVVVVEAAQLGLPVVVSDQVGLCDAVADTGAGEVVPRDAAQLTAALARVLERGRASYAAASHALAERFGWERSARDIEALYHDILAERFAPSPS